MCGDCLQTGATSNDLTGHRVGRRAARACFRLAISKSLLAEAEAGRGGLANGANPRGGAIRASASR